MSLSVRQGLKIRSGNQAYVDFGVSLFPDDFKSRVIFEFRNSTVIATTVWSENYSATTTEKRHDLLMTDSTTLRYQYYRADGTGSALSFLVALGIVKDRIYDITIEKVGLTLNIIMDGILISSNTLASDARTTVGLSPLATLKLGQKRNAFIGDIDIYYFDIEGVVKCDFSNGQGTTLTDTSGNGNNGTIYRATWAIKKAGTVKSIAPRAGNIVPNATLGPVNVASTATPTQYYFRNVGSATVETYSMDDDGVIYVNGTCTASSDIRLMSPEFTVNKNNEYEISYKVKVIQWRGTDNGKDMVLSGTVANNFSFSEYKFSPVTQITLDDGWIHFSGTVPAKTFMSTGDKGRIAVFMGWSIVGAVEAYFKDFNVIERNDLKPANRTLTATR